MAKLRPQGWEKRIHIVRSNELGDSDFIAELDDEESYGTKENAMGEGMVAVDDMWKEKRKVTMDDLMRSGQLGYFTPEFEETFQYKKGTTVWYKSITHLDQWIKAEVEAYAGADLDGVRYYNLDVTMSAIKHDPCTRRENVNENKIRSLEEGIPEGEQEYKGGAAMWINPHMRPPRKRQFRPQPVEVKKDVGHPKTMFWRDGPRTETTGEVYPDFEYIPAPESPGEFLKVEEVEEEAKT